MSTGMITESSPGNCTYLKNVTEERGEIVHRELVQVQVERAALVNHA